MRGSGRGRSGRTTIRLLLAICLVSQAATLAGCWDIRYLDKLGVVLAVGVDMGEEGKQRYKVTAQVVLPQNAITGDGGGEGSPVMTISESGDTLFEAFRKMSDKTSRRLFFSHTQLLVIGEAAARDNIYPLTDLIERNADIRSDISVVIARGVRAEQLLKIRTQMESVPASQMKETVIVHQEAYGSTYSVLVRDIARISDSEQQQVVVPAFRVKGNPEQGQTKDSVDRITPEAIPELEGMALFRDGRLAAYLTPKQARSLAWIHDKIDSTVVKFACPAKDGHYILEVLESNTTIDVVKPKPGEELPIIQVKIRLEAGVHEVTCPDFMVHDEDTWRKLEQRANRALEAEIASVADVLQKKLKIDALGWGQVIYREEPALWRKLSPNWDTLYPQVETQVQCISQIQTLGTKTNSVAEQGGPRR